MMFISTIDSIRYDSGIADRLFRAMANAEVDGIESVGGVAFKVNPPGDSDLVKWFADRRGTSKALAFEALAPFVCSANYFGNHSHHDTQPVDFTTTVNYVAATSAQFAAEMSRLGTRLEAGLPLDVSAEVRKLAEMAVGQRRDAPPEEWVDTLYRSLRELR
jgi:hypothetical protein